MPVSPLLCFAPQKKEKQEAFRFLLFSYSFSRNTSAFFRKYSTPEYTVVTTMTA